MLWVKQRGHDQFTTKKAIKFELQSNRWKILKNNVFIDGKTHVECYNPGLCSLYRQWWGFEIKFGLHHRMNGVSLQHLLV